MIDHANNEEDEDFEKQTELLDSTRIHPEHYDWARKMGIDAMDKDDQDNEEINTNAILKEVIDNPKVLKDLDLDAFASELERTGYGNKNQTLYDIRTELSARYKDCRLPWLPMTSEEIFYCLTKESPRTLHAGKLVLARVIGIARRRPTKQQRDEANPVRDDATCMWSCEFCKRNDFSEIGQVWNHFDVDGECQGAPVGVRCMLDNGCSGFLALKNLSDTRVENPDVDR
jgi:transcription elongation factor SPT6